MPELNTNVDLEAKSETGAACMVIGVICWLVAFIAMFFHPAAWISRSFAIVEYAGALALIGLIMFLFGWRARHKARA